MILNSNFKFLKIESRHLSTVWPNHYVVHNSCKGKDQRGDNACSHWLHEAHQNTRKRKKKKEKKNESHVTQCTLLPNSGRIFTNH